MQKILDLVRNTFQALDCKISHGACPRTPLEQSTGPIRDWPLGCKNYSKISPLPPIPRLSIPGSTTD